MKRTMRFFRRYRFFLVLLLINGFLIFFDPALGKEAFSLSLDNLIEMLSVIPPIFLLMGLMDVWVPKQTMMKYMGKGAGVKGGIFAFVLGSFSAGPLYAAFPVAAAFLKKGVSLVNVFLFLGAWSTTKIPMMLFEVTQFGAAFAVARFSLNLVGIVILAFLMERTTSSEEEKQIREMASSQLDHQESAKKK